MNDPYRSPMFLDPLNTELQPVRVVCPECGTRILRCRRNHLHFETPTVKEGYFCKINCSSYSEHYLPCDGKIVATNEPLGPITICGPNSRIRFGFLWLRKCQEPGTHVHQQCDRCGWKSVSKPYLDQKE